MPKSFLTKKNVPGLRDGSKDAKLTIQLFGQWEETIKMIGRLEPAIKASSIKAQLKVCNAIRTKVRAHLRNQDLEWQPLGERYAKRKATKGLDSRTLIATGGYYHAIEVWQVGSQHIVYVGVRKGVYTSTGGARPKRSKLQIAQIAAIHEFATGKKIPRRPLWNPTIAELGGSKGIQKMYINSLTWWLQKEGIKLNKTAKINEIEIKSNGL